MSEEELKAFIAKAATDKSIQERINIANTHEEVVEIAKEHGHSIDASTLRSKLAPDELEAMTGGGLSNGTFCQVTASILNCKNTGLDHCQVPTGRFECGG